MATMADLGTDGSGDAWGQRRILVSLRIERAGLELMRDQDLDDVTVEQIAREADISVRTFFRYFRNPRDILASVPVRESRRMCKAVLARPAGEPLLDAFHAWFHEMSDRDRSDPVDALEAEMLVLWSAIVRKAPELLQSESRATLVLAANLEEVVRVRLGFGPGDDEKVGVLAAALAAVIWYGYTRSILDGSLDDLMPRLDQAFDLLELLRSGATI